MSESRNVSNINLINHIRDDLKELSSIEKLAALVLASRRNTHTLQCNPSYNKIANDMCATRRTAINAINSLVTKKIISRLYDNLKSNHYLFIWDIQLAYEVSKNNSDCIFTEEEIARRL